MSGIVDNNTGRSSGLLVDPLTSKNVTISETEVTPGTAAQVTFNHVYTVGRVQVYLNGVKLVVGASNDFEATNGTTVVLATGVDTTDRLEFINL
tara:strand:- start:12052 stop:12333 length:282 start_codon:yes stop_codon:yes gene_type:complete